MRRHDGEALTDTPITLQTLLDARTAKRPIVMTTAYASWQAKLVDEAGVDAVIIGDSAAHVEDGYPSTVPMRLPEMLERCSAVWRGSKRLFRIGDAPFGSTEESVEQAVRTAVQFVQHGCDAVKVEGASDARLQQIQAMVGAGIIVMGHVGLTPQTRAKFGGYKVQYDQERIAKEAEAVLEAGTSLLLLEATPPSIGTRVRTIADRYGVPVIGVGAGPHVDGQTVILHDLLGLFSDFKPKFARRYLDGSLLIREALVAYTKDVRSGGFPGLAECYAEKSDKAEAAKLK